MLLHLYLYCVLEFMLLLNIMISDNILSDIHMLMPRLIMLSQTIYANYIYIYIYWYVGSLNNTEIEYRTHL